MESQFIEIVEIKPGVCGGDVPIFDPTFDWSRDGGDALAPSELNGNVIEVNYYDSFLGGDDLDNVNTYIIGSHEYVFDNVKFAFLQHLYDIETGKSSTIDPDKILQEMHNEVSSMLSYAQASRDVICGFECFLNGVLMRLERAGKIADMTAVIPPKPDFCGGNTLDIHDIRDYLCRFNVAISLTSGDNINIKFDIPKYEPETSQPQEIEMTQIPTDYAAIYSKFKETELRGKKMLSELIYFDSVMRIIIENINKLRENIATQI